MAHDPAAFADMVTLTVKAALAPILERVASLDARVAQAQSLEPSLATLRDRIVVIETKAAAPVVAAEPPDLTPVLERLAATEARVARLAAVELSVGELHDKCVTLETKAAMAGEADDAPSQAQLEFEGRLLNQIDLLRTRVSDLREAVQAVEAKAAQPHDVVPSGPSAAELELSMRDAVEPLKTTVAGLQERLAVLEVRPLLPGPAGKDGVPGLDGKDGAPGLNGKDGLAGLSYEGVYQEGKVYEPGQLSTWGGSTWHCNEPTTSKPGETAQAWTLMVKRGRDGKDGKDAEVVPVVSVGAGRR